jgi:hypothetical protein
MSDCKSKKCKDCNDEYLQGMLPCVTLPNSCPPGQQQCDELYSAACVTYTGNTVSCGPLLTTPLMTAGDSVQTALYNIANLLCTVANGGGGSGGSGVDPAVITALQTCCTTNTTAITSINTQLTTINNTISSIQGAVTIIQGDITTINIDIANLQSCCSNTTANGVTNNGINGITNYVTKWTSANTIGDSQIRDDGTSVGIFIAPNPLWRLYVNGNTLKGGYFSTTRVSTNVDLAIGAHGSSSGVSSQGMNIGVFGQADSNALLNVGAYGAATGVVAGVNIGMYAEASAGTSGNYSIQLKDGTQGTSGWYLRNMTGDGRANWAKINITEVTNGLSSTLLGAPNGIATLDSTSKLTIAQMPITVMDYKGTYDIVTNTPVLVDGTGNQGDVYVNTAAGTRTFGPGNTITVAVGDWLIYNGTKWEKTLGNNVGSGTVTSVGLTVGTTGTDVSVSNSPITGAGAIALNIPTASATARGLLSIADFNTFSSKVTAVSGTNNYIAKFTPDGTTIGNSQIQDDADTLSIGTTLDSTTKIKISSNKVNGIFLTNSNTSGSIKTSIAGSTTGLSSGENRGLEGSASGSTVRNTGVQGYGTSLAGSISVGGHFIAAGTGVKYSVRLSDGTEVVNKYLKCMTANGEANWGTISESDITGFGTYAKVGTYTNEYITRWNATTNTLIPSLIRDNGSTLSSGVALDANTYFKISTSLTNGLAVTNTHTGSNNTVAINGISSGVNTGADNTGTRGFASGNPNKNIGVYGYASGASTINVGVLGYATGGTDNYAIQLKDGSETVLGGRYLRDMGDGKGRWSTIPMLDSSQIMCSDMFTVITANATTNASTIKAYWAAPCNGTFTDMFASLFTAQVGGAAFTVVIRASGGLVGTLTFANAQNTSPIITSTSSFTKGNIYEFYVTQAGDGSARGLLVTLNYQRT